MEPVTDRCWVSDIRDLIVYTHSADRDRKLTVARLGGGAEESLVREN